MADKKEITQNAKDDELDELLDSKLHTEINVFK